MKGNHIKSMPAIKKPDTDVFFETIASICKDYNNRLAQNNFQPLNEVDRQIFIAENSKPSDEVIEYFKNAGK